MKRALAAIVFAAALMAGLTPAMPQGGIANFPQTVPAQTVVGRLGIAPGPTQAIPISQLAAAFGASRSVTVNAKCNGTTDDTAAINADLALGGYWTLPPGRTCNVTQLNITQNGTRLSGAGYNSSIIQGTTASVPTINVAATLSSIYLDGFQVTKSVTATSGGNGINYAGDCQYCVIDGVYVQKSYVGIAAKSTGVGSIRHVLAQLNINAGITFTNSAISGTLQWDLDDVFSGQNGGQGYSVSAGVAGPLGIALGSWHNVRTFANTGVGISVACSASIPCSGFRLSKGLLGEDGNHEIYLDTYGTLNTITDTIVELAGTRSTGPTFGTPAAHTGDGIRITANNFDVSIGDVTANGNYDSGINTSASVSTNISSRRISYHNLYGILSADCAKLTVTSVNFVSNTSAHIQCTTNNGSQLVTTSTPATLNTGTPVGIGVITGLGTGVATALGVNVGSAGAMVVNGGALGTPSSGVATNLTGTAAGLTAGNVTTNANLTGAVTSVGNATSLGSFTSASLASALTNETGTGVAVFGTSPTISTLLSVTANSGTPAAAAVAGTVTRVTGVDGATARLGVDSYGTGVATAFSAVNLRRANGTAVTPTAVQSGDILFGYVGTGYGASDFLNGGGGGLIGVASQTFTGSAGGTEVYLSTTPNGATVNAEAIRILNNGQVKFTATANFSANAAVATTMTSVGPTGANTTVQEWLTIKNSAGTTRYIPAY